MQTQSLGEQNQNASPALSSELQSQIDAFNADSQQYQDDQQYMTETIAEASRLLAAANALEQQANEANANWKAMARERHTDQQKINAEINRSMRCREDAQTLRMTAQVRKRVTDELAVGLAEQRIQLASAARALNTEHVEASIKAITEDLQFQELAGSLIAYCRHQAEAKIKSLWAINSAPPPEEDVITQTNELIASYVRKAAHMSDEVPVALLVRLPARKRGELVTESAAQVRLARQVLNSSEEATVTEKWLADNPSGGIEAHEHRHSRTLGGQLNTI